MKMYLYNTMTRSKDEFVPLEEGKVKMYTCGPTVYGDPHVGNMRAYFFADMLKASLQSVGGYEVHHIMNITDVGHLTDDGDQ
jgi:cysteinyl-tRNA synthetase